MSGEQVKVLVRNLAFGGSGVGVVQQWEETPAELFGITAFVPFTAVGELVLARVIEQKKSYLTADLIEVLEPSLERDDPKCRFFKNCGGCELQHMNYEEQLSAKLEMLRSALAVQRLPSEVLSVVQPFIYDTPYHYRRRISLHIDTSGKIGFYRANSRSVVPIDSCSVAVPALNNSLADIQGLGRELAGRCSSLVLEADDQGVVAVIKSPYDLAPEDARRCIDTTKKYFPNVTLLCGEREIEGQGRKILDLPTGDHSRVPLQVPAGSFSQVNWGVNRKLVESVVDESDLLRGQTVWDLYSGAGNFAVPLARIGGRVTAVEVDPRLVNLGKQNARASGLEKQIEYIESSVEKFFQIRESKRETKERVDLIVADPPRSGLGNLVPLIRQTNKLIFISCHLPSFVRDTKALVELGWRTKTIIPFDMFPQTSYVEILGVFER